VSTAGVLRNGGASNVFVRTKTKVYVRERPSDPKAIGEYYPTGREKVHTALRHYDKNGHTPPGGEAIRRGGFSKITQHPQTH